MNKQIRFLSTMFILLFAVVALQAQRGPRDFDPEKAAKRQTESMTEELSLNKEQVAQVETLNLKYAKQLEATRAEASEDRSKARETMEGIRDEQDNELKGILSEQQYADWQKVVAERREKMKGRRGGRRGKEKR